MVECPFSGRCPTGCLDAIARGEDRLCTRRSRFKRDEFVSCVSCRFARPTERVDWGVAWVRCTKSAQEMPLRHAGCSGGQREVA